MQTQRNAGPSFSEVGRAIGVKADLARAAARELKLTEAYEQARRDGRARQWLYGESQSFAESAYMVLMDRVDEANV